ncbi:hypothetical protein PM082_007128 [Marasmius tenuissimus]|nr:hypothetical protein PM082_007128 [Marasmius tenuissimus]
MTAIGSLATGIVLVQGIYRVPTVESLGNREHMLEVSFINLFAAFSQCVSTYCLWHSFRSHINEAPDAPQSLFERLSAHVLSRGVVLTVIHFILAVLYLVRPDRLWWTPFHHVIPPLYYMSTVATLNIRNTPATQDDELDSSSPIGISSSARRPQLISRARNSTSTALRAMSPVGRFSVSTAARPRPFLELHPMNMHPVEKIGFVPDSRPKVGTMGEIPSLDHRSSCLSTASSEVEETKATASSSSRPSTRDRHSLPPRKLPTIPVTPSSG